MKKIVFSIVIFFFFIGVNAIEIKSNNAILYNLNDNNIIYEKNAYDKVQIASLTKIITAITYIENNDDLDTKITITNNMLKGLDGYVKVGLYNGLKITKRELLYALMLPSAADAAQALAISNSGSISAFADLMNEEVKKIGVKNTHFTNPVGMDDDNNYSTAYDIAQILKYALNNETFKTIFESDEYYISSINKKINKTVKDKERDYKIDTTVIKGAKTGFTTVAGLCLASTATLNDVNYLLINIGAPIDYPYHITDAVDIYNYYDTNYKYVDILNVDDFLVSIKVKNSKLKEYKVYSNKDIKKYMLKDTTKDNLTYKYEGIELITNKLDRNDKLGTISIYDNDILLDTYDVYLDIDIKYYNFKLYISIIVVLLILFIFKSKTKKKRKRLSKKRHF